MRTAKCITLAVVMTWVGIVPVGTALGQGPPAAPEQSSQHTLPAKRDRDCVVTIAVDPTIMALTDETLDFLVHSESMLLKAGRDILSLEEEDLHGLWRSVAFKRLSTPSAAILPATKSPQEGRGMHSDSRDMQKKLEEIYGPAFSEMMGIASPAARQPVDLQQRATIRLFVGLRDTMPPVADELLRAIIENLQDRLSRAHQGHVANLRHWLRDAEAQRREAEAVLTGATEDSPAARQVKEQLDTIVDLYGLGIHPFVHVLGDFQHSVDPPLPIVVLWKDLREAAGVEPETPVHMFAMPRVRLGTALDLVLKVVSTEPVTYRIHDNVIVIGTPAAIGMSGHLSIGPEGQSDIRALATRTNELTRMVQSLELELAGMEARRKAIQEQLARAEAEANQRLGEDTVTRELEKLVQINTQTLATLRNQVEAGRSSPVELARAEESLTRARIELAKRREEVGKQIGAGRIEQFNNELSRIAIDRAEKQVQWEILRKQADGVQRQLTRASMFDPEAARIRLARERLDMIDRRIIELETRIATLQPPSVVVIGAN